EVAVLARDPVALRDCRCALRDLRDLLELAGSGAHAHDRGDLVPKCSQVELGVVARDHARSLEAADALPHGWGPHPPPAAELGDSDPAGATDALGQHKVG